MSIFGRRLTPLTYKEVITALRVRGFVMSPKTATAHEKWILQTESHRYVVTVDKHIAPFDVRLIKSMTIQAGLTPRKFHALCKGGKMNQDDEQITAE